MNGELMLYRDQYGNTWFARTIAELRESVGGGRVSKMYSDTRAGAVHVGYVVGQFWCTAFKPVRNPA